MFYLKLYFSFYEKLYFLIKFYKNIGAGTRRKKHDRLGIEMRLNIHLHRFRKKTKSWEHGEVNKTRSRPTPLSYLLKTMFGYIKEKEYLYIMKDLIY